MASQILACESTHDIDITTALEQNSIRGQDQTFCGITPSKKQYFGVWDGHGTNSVIQELRKIQKTGKLDIFMDNSSPVCAINDELLVSRVCSETECSGSTMCYGMVDGNKLTITNCGDSRMFVFRNGELIFASDEHYFGNPKEKARLDNKIHYQLSTSIKVVAEKEMLGVYSEYVCMKNGTLLATTQALGHCNYAEPAPDVTEFTVELTDEIVAVAVTDGITDILIQDAENNIRPDEIRMIYELSAEELKDKIQARWLQEWNMTDMKGQVYPPSRYTKDQCDDIAVARLVMRPKL